MELFINNNWEFVEEFNDGFLNGRGNAVPVRIPHTCKEVGYNHWDASEYQMLCGYRRSFVPDDNWKGKRIFIKFHGVAHEATVYLNGNQVGVHSCGYTAFSFEITGRINWGSVNIIAVKVDTRESLNIPPFGFVIDYMTYGGIYREVSLEILEKTYIEDVFVRADHKGHFECDIRTDGEKETLNVRLSVNGPMGEIHTGSFTTLEGVGKYTGECGNITPWTPDNPRLYEAVVTLMSEDEILDERKIKFGFRTAEFKSNGFYLNGSLVRLIGLNRHQCYPYAGYAMPRSMQVLDADILKNELGVNIVRTSHYPQSQHFIDRCDEIGLLVFTEIPGWQHIGDEDWQEQAITNTREMIMQYRNHPSIIVWGVRINESQDNDVFYKRTNRAAHDLDPTRATTGVRFLEKSSLLEDVYAFNDFSHTGNNPGLKGKKVTSDKKKGFIVSECNGHMYPTKSFDDEEHRLSHALRHAAVIESMSASKDIAGVLGWCMFDYNTHRDFGSGDGICYHGVMDMFRNPKLAAAVYASQSDNEPVCEVSSSMDIGEHPAGQVGDVVVFTNASSVKLYKDGDFVKEFYPDRKKYGHMPHPPVIIDDYIGELLETKENYPPKLAAKVKSCLRAIAKYGQSNLPPKYILRLAGLMLFHHFTYADGMRLYGTYVANWGGQAPKYRFEAIEDGRVIKTVERMPGTKIHLVALADHTDLREADTYDVAAIRIRVEDEFGNTVPYFMEPIGLKADGCIDIIGPSVISLKGGMGGTYIRSRQTGVGRLMIHSAQAGVVTIDFKID